jgi:glycosyltransferase involved in cell wall biosynthesis
MFLKAAALVAAERPDVRFVCVGHGKESYLQELKQLSRTLGIESKVHWIQAQSEVRAVYNAIDVFCSASFSEGFPNVIGEAMACGRHCVATDVGDSALVIGDTGVVVPSDNAQAFAAGLLDRLNAGDTMNLGARQRILENFTVAHLGDKSEYALYQAIQQPYPNLSPNEEAARSADA